MIQVGITGGIGSGKSTVARIIEQNGYPVFNSDKVAKELMITDYSIIHAIKKIFGTNAYVNGELNRSCIAKKIFNNSSLRTQLNQIVHPAVRKAFKSWVQRQEVDLVFNEAAILLETGNYKNFDFILLITAPEDLRIQRVVKRDNSSPEEVKKIIDNQSLDMEKEKIASFVILNDSLSSLGLKVKEILNQIEKRIR